LALPQEAKHSKPRWRQTAGVCDGPNVGLFSPTCKWRGLPPGAVLNPA
jgi:hypothetical protein